MTFYESEIKRIGKIAYSNREQLDVIIATRRFIDSHYDADLNLDMLSDSRFISKYHLLRLFKKYYGQTPRQYLIDKRIEQSKAYLKKGTGVAETCFLVGFESPCSFCTLFKSRTGRTPSAYQKEQLSQSPFAEHPVSSGH